MLWVITSDENFMYINLNDIPGEYVNAKIRRSSIRSVCLLNPSEYGVVIVFDDSKKLIIKHSLIDSIDGDTSITTNEALFDKLKGLM